MIKKKAIWTLECLGRVQKKYNAEKHKIEHDFSLNKNGLALQASQHGITEEYFFEAHELIKRIEENPYIVLHILDELCISEKRVRNFISYKNARVRKVFPADILKIIKDKIIV